MKYKRYHSLSLSSDWFNVNFFARFISFVSILSIYSNFSVDFLRTLLINYLINGLSIVLPYNYLI